MGTVPLRALWTGLSALGGEGREGREGRGEGRRGEGRGEGGEGRGEGCIVHSWSVAIPVVLFLTDLLTLQGLVYS